jgi:hypothetical protein
MKKIVLTESQYKRLVIQKLNEESTITDMGEKVNDFDIDLEGKIIRRWNENNSEHVIRIQKMLKSLGYELGPYGENKDGIDGIYGPFTEDAVREFQEDEMPNQPDQHDGILGPITYELLKGKVDEKSEDEGVEVDDLLDATSTISDVGDIDRPESGEDDMVYDIEGDIDIKGNELTNGGPISIVWETILNDLDDQLDDKDIYYLITAGNDKFHQGRNSRHNIGCAVDFAIRKSKAGKSGIGKKKFNKKYADRIYDIMYNLEDKYGEEYGFSWLDEYNRTTKHATGGHIHMSISREFCGGRSGKEITQKQELPT